MWENIFVFCLGPVQVQSSLTVIEIYYSPFIFFFSPSLLSLSLKDTIYENLMRERERFYFIACALSFSLSVYTSMHKNCVEKRVVWWWCSCVCVCSLWIASSFFSSLSLSSLCVCVCIHVKHNLLNHTSDWLLVLYDSCPNHPPTLTLMYVIYTRTYT